MRNPRKILVGLAACLVFLTSSVTTATAELSPAQQGAIKSMGLTPLADAPQSVNFELKTLDGKVVKLSDFKGKIVLLNFWATWCPPCRAEMPSMQQLFATNKSSDFVMLTIDAQEKSETVASFIKKTGYGFPVLLDTTGKVNSQYGIKAIPTSFIIDRDGRIIGGKAGAHDWADSAVQKGLQTLLAKK